MRVSGKLAGVGLAFVLAAGVALAQTVGEKAREAEALLERGRTIEAIDTLDEAVVALWQRAPFSFRRTVWVSEPAAGYGIYKERPNAVFTGNQPMLVYAEPIGFGWRKVGDLYQSDFAADVIFRSPDGKELFRKDDFLNVALTGRYRNREFFANLTYTLTNAPKGDYLVETVFRDRVSGKSGNFSLPFSIR